MNPLRPSLFAVVTLALGAAECAADQPVAFRREVMSVVSKAGCNMGACHGNGNGKGGLKLSLRGQDPDLDWQALTRDQGGRRVNVVEPEKSLILMKATGTVAHEGGKRFTPGSPEYGVFLTWLNSGARDSKSDTGKVQKLTVTPIEQVLLAPTREVQLTAKATFSDGTERDITRFAVFEPNNNSVKISPEGKVQALADGETTVMVRYLDQQAPVHLAFLPPRPNFRWVETPAHNYIDEQVFKKLRLLRMNPSDPCSDEVFVRRAYLDLLGLVPTADEARAFLEDPAADKRAHLIEALLARDEFADFWALKWADLMKIEERQLDKDGMKVFHGWIRQAIAENRPLNEFARAIIAARGSTLQNPPANWWRANRDPVTRAENTARVFLGTQLNCAQCHNHPFERWTQDDYYNWTTLFARIDYKLSDAKGTDKNDKHEFRGDQTVLIKPTGSVINPRTGDQATPRFLGGEAPKTSKDRDELIALADWMSKTPMFARTQVNRVWFHLLGRGLVEPVDDFRASNPASHPELLDQLAKDFVAHQFDLRWLIRTITASRTYQLSSSPNDTNAPDETNFSHAVIRRLTAEQLADSVSAVLKAPLRIDGFPSGTRLTQIPEGKKHYKPLVQEVDRFAASFGKPPRLIASDCERTNDVALPQAFQLISGPFLQELLTREGNRLSKLLDSKTEPEPLVQELYWTTLTRAPSQPELQRSVEYLNSGPSQRKAAEDLAWALLNSKEFLFRR